MRKGDAEGLSELADNVAEAGLSGVFAFKNIYETVEVKKEEIEKITEIFKLVKDNVR